MSSTLTTVHWEHNSLEPALHAIENVVDHAR